MTNFPLRPEEQKENSLNLKALAYELSQLVTDQTEYALLSLPEQAVLEIQKTFTIRPAKPGITGDAG